MDNKNKTQLNKLLKKDLVQYAIDLQEKNYLSAREKEQLKHKLSQYQMYENDDSYDIYKSKEEISMLHNVINEYKKENEKLKEGEEKAYDYIIELNKLREENKKLENRIKIKDKQITELTLQLH
jgi:DNA helicase HerA-like ATPase